MQRGKIIVIEGTDGSGKRTQSGKLNQRLLQEGFPGEVISFPRYETPTGKLIASYLGRGCEPILGSPDKVHPLIASPLYTMDRFAALPEINRALNSGVNLIFDRYVESNMGHQGGKLVDSREREELFRKLDELEYGIFGLPRPTLTLFLHVPPKISLKLLADRGELTDGHESLEHLENAEQAYLQLASIYNWTSINCVLNGEMRSKEDISKEICRLVIPCLRR